MLFGLSLFTHASGLVRVEAVVSYQVRALGRDVLGEFGDEVQGPQHLEIPFGPGGDPVAVRIGWPRTCSYLKRK